MLMAFLLACKDDKITLDDSESTTITDSGLTDIGTDTGDSTETTTTSGVSVTFQLSGEWGGTTVSISQLLSDADGNFSIGDPMATGPSSSNEVALTLKAPSTLIPNPDVPGSEYAFFVSSLHTDDDGDGYPSGFEVVSGMSEYWLLFWKGELPIELQQAGFVEGWNVYNPVQQILGSLSAVPLDSNLLPTETISLAGGFSDMVDPSYRLMLYPQAADQQSVSSLLWDEALTDPWSIYLDQAPDTDHFYDANGTILALEFPVVYADADGSGGPSNGDTLLYYACNAAGEQVELLYLPEITDLFMAVYYVNQGLRPGWLGASTNANGLTFLAEADLLTLQSCAVPN